MNEYRTVAASGSVLPIAPSPLVSTAGQKRKLTENSASNNAIHVAATMVSSSNAIPRRESAPATLARAVAEPIPASMKPSDYWKSLLEEWQVPILDTVGIEQDDADNPDKNVTFLETTSDRVEAYQNIELLTAVRRRDLVTLKRIAAEKRASGSTMNACNRFGESILHLACRKGSLDVVELLVGDSAADGCGCSLLLRDDYGRTVLHDACWTVSPPWALIKLILKKAPVLWRVSDVRGHLALQYVPKSAWPQWSAFLSKNKDLLQRIMVHSYHQIDILQQQQPHPVQAQAQPQHPPTAQQAPQPMDVVKQEGFPVQDSSTSDASGVPPQQIPQHQQQQQTTTPKREQQHLPMPLPTPASLPVSTHNSDNKLHPRTEASQAVAQPASQAQTKPAVPNPLPALGGATAQQAQDVLARALAQANPAMVWSISRSQGLAPHGQPLQQGLSRFSPVTPTATTVVKSETAPQQQPPEQQQQPPAPGPATAALDEALRAQSVNRSKARSNLLMTDEQHQAQKNYERPHKAPSNHRQPQKPQANSDDGGSKAPLPYAPSISMIAARLAGYQQKKNAATAAANKEASPVEASLPRNPLPAVPNPLLAVSENEVEAHVVAPQQEASQGVPTSITTTSKNHGYGRAVPNPIAAAAAAESCREQDAPSEFNNSNSISSLTMSASPSVVEEAVSETTTNDATTDSDSDRAVASSSTSNNQDSTSNVSEGDAQANADQGEDDDNKASLNGSKKRIVG